MEQTSIDRQLALDIASRKNLYVVAKWFNFAFMILSIILFIIFLSTLTGISNEMGHRTQSLIRTYTFLVIVSMINVITSFIFWFYTRQIALSVGTPEEISHTAFGICDLLFSNWISGILILVASSSFNSSKTLRAIAAQQRAL